MHSLSAQSNLNRWASWDIAAPDKAKVILIVSTNSPALPLLFLLCEVFLATPRWGGCSEAMSEDALKMKYEAMNPVGPPASSNKYCLLFCLYRKTPSFLQIIWKGWKSSRGICMCVEQPAGVSSPTPPPEYHSVQSCVESNVYCVKPDACSRCLDTTEHITQMKLVYIYFFHNESYEPVIVKLCILHTVMWKRKFRHLRF